MSLLLMLPLTGSVIACVATASRQIWAFARDNGVPFSATVRHVRCSSLSARYITCADCSFRSTRNPVSLSTPSSSRSSYASCYLSSSTAALNAILALDLASLLSSYMISISCIALKRVRGKPLPPREWSLGRWGLPINIAALIWLLPIFVFTLFPSVTPVTATGMNWGCLLFGFVVLFSTGYYIIIDKRVYISPKERPRRELQGAMP